MQMSDYRVTEKLQHIYQMDITIINVPRKIFKNTLRITFRGMICN